MIWAFLTNFEGSTAIIKEVTELLKTIKKILGAFLSNFEGSTAIIKEVTELLKKTKKTKFRSLSDKLWGVYGHY